MSPPVGAREQALYQRAAMVILRDFYVDDLLTGTDEEESATELCHQITKILAKGQLPIRKW